MKLKRIEVTICEACLNGEGDVCHTPGCALCRHAVDLSIDPLEYVVLEEWDVDGTKSRTEVECMDCHEYWDTREWNKCPLCNETKEAWGEG